MKCRVGDEFKCKPNSHESFIFHVDDIEQDDVTIRILSTCHENWKIGDVTIWSKELMFGGLVNLELTKENKVLRLIKEVDGIT